MPTRTARVSVATYAYAPKPAKEFATTARDRIRVDSGEAIAYFRVSNPVPAGERAVSATLEVAFEDDSSAALTAQRTDSPGRPYKDINWGNKPGVRAGSVAVSGTQVGSTRRRQFVVTADVAAGARTLDFRITSASTAARWLKGVRSANGFPVLTVQTEVIPEAPVDLLPQGVISVAAPMFQWTAQDGTDQVQVQVGTLDVNGDWATTTWDSGAVPSAVGQLDSAALGWAGLADGGSAAWRARQHVPAGWSDYSDPVEIARIPKPVLTVTNPGATDADPTPPVQWTFAGQVAWQVIVKDANGKILADSLKRAGADSSWTPPVGARSKNQAVTRIVRAWDGQPRSGTANDRAYAEVTVSTTYVPTATVTPVAGMAASQDVESPAVRVPYTRTSTPDEAILYRDGAEVQRKDGVDGPFVDWTCPPNTQVTYSVAAVVNGKASEAAIQSTIRTEVTGLWLVDPATGRSISLAGADLNYSYGEVSSVYTPLRAAQLVRRTSSLRGAEGTFTGSLDPRGGRILDDLVADLWWMRERPDRVLRLIVGDLNIPVVVSNLYPVLDTEWSMVDNIQKVATFTFAQVGELPFEVI